MASVINTNINSLNTQRNLSASQSSLSTAMARLSSGMRINSGADDASGLAIATKMDSQIRGMNVAIRNSNDAISFSQTADGSLSSVTDSLQRMRELAVQGANGTTDNASLAAEFTQLQSEITRVTNNANFNGTNTLGAAAATGLTFQVGAGTTINDSVTITGADLTIGPTASLVTTATTAKTAAATAKATSDAAAALAASTGAAGDITAAATALAAYNTAATAYTTANNAALATGSKTAGAASSALISVGTVADAKAALTQIDAAIGEVNSDRATFGAVQNRFTAIVSNLQSSSQNQSAAKSRIMDTDFAAETANLTRAQILQQAGTAMLAQANSQPNGVLALLRG